MLRGSAFLTVLFLSTFKFVVAPGVGFGAGLSFVETVAANVLGAWLSAALFAALAGAMMRRAAARRRGERRIFTRKNKWIVRLKRSRWGFLLVVALCPTFLSVPLGTIVTMKFYGHRRATVPAILGSLAAWSLLFTGLVHLVGGPAHAAVP